jgi:hypothetical protein
MIEAVTLEHFVLFSGMTLGAFGMGLASGLVWVHVVKTAETAK